MHIQIGLNPIEEAVLPILGASQMGYGFDQEILEEARNALKTNRWGVYASIRLDGVPEDAKNMVVSDGRMEELRHVMYRMILERLCLEYDVSHPPRLEETDPRQAGR